MPTIFHLTPITSPSKAALRGLADFIEPLWHDTYDALIGRRQVNYMLETFQSPQAIQDQIANKNYTYYYITSPESPEPLGYCALAPQPPRLFLSKLYLRSDLRSQGLGQQVLAKIADLARAQHLSAVYLTVNKGNARAIRAYEKAGFKRIDSVVSDIGNGFAMDDYIYQLSL